LGQVGNHPLLDELRLVTGTHDGEAKVIDAAARHPLGQHRGVAQLVALAREQQRQLRRLPQPLGILLGELGPQVRERGRMSDTWSTFASPPSQLRAASASEPYRIDAIPAMRRSAIMSSSSVKPRWRAALRLHFASFEPMRVVASA
jgi:hypothetical protein